MVRFLKQRWFAARALAVLQEYYEQPLRQPLPTFEQKLLDGAVNVTIKDGGTPFDAATRFYTVFAESAVRTGRDLAGINFGGVIGRLWTIRDKMKHFDEHKAALQSVREYATASSNEPIS